MATGTRHGTFDKLVQGSTRYFGWVLAFDTEHFVNTADNGNAGWQVTMLGLDMADGFPGKTVVREYGPATDAQELPGWWDDADVWATIGLVGPTPAFWTTVPDETFADRADHYLADLMGGA
jgi:hypothetical protein